MEATYRVRYIRDNKVIIMSENQLLEEFTQLNKLLLQLSCTKQININSKDRGFILIKKEDD